MHQTVNCLPILNMEKIFCNIGEAITATKVGIKESNNNQLQKSIAGRSVLA